MIEVELVLDSKTAFFVDHLPQGTRLISVPYQTAGMSLSVTASRKQPALLFPERRRDMRESARKRLHAWCVCFGCDGLNVVLPGFFALLHGILRSALNFGIMRFVTGRQQRTVMVGPRQVQCRFRLLVSGLLKSGLLKVAALDFAH